MMKTNTTNKKAYQAPVIRSVEFNVEKGFAGSGTPFNPETVHAFRMEDVTRQESSSNFSYTWN